MDLKLDGETLYEVEKTMEKDSQDLDKAIETITDALEELRGIWEGQDADKFFNNTREFFEKMKGIPMCMRNMGKFMNKANKDLNEKDAEFSKELETEVTGEYQSYSGGRDNYKFSDVTGKYQSHSGGRDNYILSDVTGEYQDHSGGRDNYSEVNTLKGKKSSVMTNVYGKGDAIQNPVSSLGKYDALGGLTATIRDGGNHE